VTRRRRLSIVAIIVVIEVALDQLTKSWAKSSLQSGRTISVMPTVDFRLAFNSGFSFSTGSSRGQLITILVAAIAGFLVWQIMRETRTPRAILMTVILGGAIGNLIDRVFRAHDGLFSGRVIDFIDVSWYAVFNVADMCVVVGAVTLVIHEVLHERRSAKAVSEPGQDLHE